MSAPKDRHSLTAYFLDSIGKKPIFDPKHMLSFLLNSAAFSAFQKLIDYNFKNKELLLNAFMHRSFVHEFGAQTFKNNEVLEFLGDSLLGANVALYLVQNYPSLSEGQLSKMKSSLVSEGPLCDLAQVIELDHFVLLGRGEFNNGGTQLPSIQSSALEALFAAIYLDGGQVAAQRFFNLLLERYQQQCGKHFIHPDRFSTFDAKSRLQELTMKDYKSLPEYRSQQLEDKQYCVQLWINNNLVHQITDISKKRAEKLLAQYALDLMQKEGE